MSKQEALEFVHGIRMTSLLGLVLQESFNPALTASVIRGKQYGFAHGQDIPVALALDPLADALESPTERRIIVTNLQLMLKHALVRHTFEIVKAYAEDTGQEGTFKAWPGYDFARLVRNTLSHRNGALLHRWSPPTLRSATWRQRVITPADVGTYITLNAAEYVQLQEDLYELLRDRLG
jgi:hypothetical protein